MIRGQVFATSRRLQHSLPLGDDSNREAFAAWSAACDDTNTLHCAIRIHVASDSITLHR